ncbi:MAG TPA: type II toxin-antitoxin system RelE/ParE family toxin [Ignavibacteriaceae bacterium]|nr:type II toxin-antitoxin system RelE/ParE family toxin [Ignavibacteriaceae bacterium]
MVEVNWTDQSLDDIQNIAEYIAKDSESYAKIQVQRFFSRIEILYKYPESRRMVPEIGDASIRELIIGNYRIIYHIVNNKRIEILTVHHSRRLLDDKFE